MIYYLQDTLQTNNRLDSEELWKKLPHYYQKSTPTFIKKKYMGNFY